MTEQGVHTSRCCFSLACLHSCQALQVLFPWLALFGTIILFDANGALLEIVLVSIASLLLAITIVSSCCYIFLTRAVNLALKHNDNQTQIRRKIKSLAIYMTCWWVITSIGSIALIGSSFYMIDKESSKLTTLQNAFIYSIIACSLFQLFSVIFGATVFHTGKELIFLSTHSNRNEQSGCGSHEQSQHDREGTSSQVEHQLEATVAHTQVNMELHDLREHNDILEDQLQLNRQQIAELEGQHSQKITPSAPPLYLIEDNYY
ncbi:uncharacterized protein LOC128244706 [Mya arenaria]|uniref:uncharacterized protein LOC128244706 n=1 Tax=Mya arenaria TaxID=6604 RepID=UPI0022E8044B|nr:uncharacterized protein LOC128244706 [Mya arenaria]